MEKATLLVLAGGASRRMGRPKAELPFGSGTLLEHMIRQLSPACSEVLVSGPGGLSDLHPGAGPLAGIEAGLLAARHDLLFAAACDMPLLTRELAEQVLAAAAGHDAAVPRLGGRPEPLAAAYRKSALKALTAALDAGRNRAADLLATLDVAWLDGLDPAPFANANDPAAYRALLDALR